MNILLDVFPGHNLVRLRLPLEDALSAECHSSNETAFHENVRNNQHFVGRGHGYKDLGLSLLLIKFLTPIRMREMSLWNWLHTPRAG